MKDDTVKLKFWPPERRVLVGLSGFVILILLLWLVPERQAQYYGKDVPAKDFPLLANEFRKTLAQIMGGLLLLVGLYLNLRRIKAVEREVRSSEEGQITERFTRAIEQLGSEKPEVRLGGIYALERIAKDSPKDHWTVMEVLTAFIRDKAPWKMESDENGGEAAGEGEPTPDYVHTLPPFPKPPGTDLQAALTVICRRTRQDVDAEILDLSGTDLRASKLSGGLLERVNLALSNLQHANLQGARLNGARLHFCNMKETFLRDTNLNDSKLDSAHLEGADLTAAVLCHASLEDAHLDMARMIGANLTGAVLSSAYMQRARLHKATLDNANLDSADLRRAVINEASLRDADLSFANLRDATFAGSDLTNAHLDGANVEGTKFHTANLTGTHLEGVDLRLATGLTKEQIDTAIINEETQLPDALMLQQR